MAGRGLLCAVAALLLAPPASAGPWADAARARAGLDRAVAGGRLAPLEADRYKTYATEAAAATDRMPGSRGANLAGNLAIVAAQSWHYDHPRAVALFEMLRFNTWYLGRAALPPRGRDVRDGDGIVYRSVPGLGLQYHPLATFGKLNADVTAGRYRRSVRLAYALLARGRPSGGATIWETYYRTSGGQPPWSSGMTQAVAAQALARTGFVPHARAAYRAIPSGLLLWLGQGPWIRLYHFNSDLVLNAQLQAALSIAEYGRIAGDAGAARLAAQLRESAAALLPRFDTGEWTRYALGGGDAEITYHGYVASLLWKLQAATGEPRWGKWAARFRFYWRAPPQIRRGPPPDPVLPVPREGFRDVAELRFWLSKPATVTLRVAGESRAQWLPAGSHVLRWAPGTRPPGEYDVLLSAVDRVGNRGEARLGPVRVERDNEPPRVDESELDAGRLAWRVTDGQTPWVGVRLVLRRGGAERALKLGRRKHAGAVTVELPEEQWHATLVVSDSSGNSSATVLGTLNPRARFAE